MKILEEIRQQPVHIRKLFMWSLVTVSFSFVGMLWFADTKQNVLALMGNASVREVTDSSEKKVESPFGMIGKSFGSLKAEISGLFSGSAPSSETAKDQPEQSALPAQPLPVK